jgi:hypothetical protein
MKVILLYLFFLVSFVTHCFVAVFGGKKILILNIINLLYIMLFGDNLTGAKGRTCQVSASLSQCCTNFQSIQQTNGLGNVPSNDNPSIEQNQPNPFSQNTIINYNIPSSSKDAVIRIETLDGQILNTFKVSNGVGQILISGGTLAAGTYFYQLYIDGKMIDSKKMVLLK